MYFAVCGWEGNDNCENICLTVYCGDSDSICYVNIHRWQCRLLDKQGFKYKYKMFNHSGTLKLNHVT